MSTVLLSAASAELPALGRLEELVKAELARDGETDVHVFDLAKMKLGYCQGEFDCWVKTPGICRAHDAEQEIVQAVHDARRLVLVDVVTFGGHSYALKRAQDRMICLISPFFTKRSALTHHAARYERAADLFVLGWTPVADEEETRTWCELADANAINLFAPRVGATVVDDANHESWGEAVHALFVGARKPGDGITEREPLRRAMLEAASPFLAQPNPEPPRTAALLIGSAKIKGTSISENLARALSARLEAAGVTTELHFATEFLHDGSARSAAQAIAKADLFVLVMPLYVDALPALATRALETLAAMRKTNASPSRFVLLVNSGFPEPEQSRTALRITRHFAARAGYHFAGGLPLGGGGAVNPTAPLDAQHGPAEHVKHALDLASSALARGDDVPRDALDAMIRPPLPDVVYRLMGDLGFRYQAYRNAVPQGALHAKPLER
jgi:multimeric flavodoxin WrbA